MIQLNEATRSNRSHLLSVVLVYLHMCWIPCGLGSRAYFWAWQKKEPSVCSIQQFFHLSSPFYFPLFISVLGACLRGGMGLMAGLSGFASHRCSLHVGAGCKQWKLQDISGTQPPHIDPVVKPKVIYCYPLLILFIILKNVMYRPGGGGDSYMKQTGMLVVLLRGVNFGFWSR